MLATRANHGRAEGEVPSINDGQRGWLSETFHQIKIHTGNIVFRKENTLPLNQATANVAFPSSPSLQ